MLQDLLVHPETMVFLEQLERLDPVEVLVLKDLLEIEVPLG